MGGEIVNAFSKKASLSVAIVLILLGTSFAAVIMNQFGTQDSFADVVSNDLAAALADGRVADKIDPALLEMIGSTAGPMMVYVVMSDVAKANDVLVSNGLKTVRGMVLQGAPTIRFMELDAGAIVALARSDAVMKILAYETPTTEPANLELAKESFEATSTPPAVEDLDVNEVHGAVDAWDSGFTGEGVRLAVIDDGFDMAHPDMQGQQARYDFGPYEGWPIAYDDYAAYRWDEEKIGGWMADTSTEIRAKGQFVTFDDVRYVIRGLTDVDGNVVASKSGMVHIGYHPDPVLATLWGGPVAVLVVDTKTAGVYDTVYVDVMRDFSFANDKPCTKGDEISYFDSYDPITNITDTSMWNAGDGYADYSGGMAYWISDGVNVYPASDWTYGAEFVAGAGDGVAFIGAFAGSHGTMTSSAALATGVTMDGQLGGMAPDAKLICIPFTGDVVNAWRFAQFGADGILGTGDEAMLVSNSYGWSDTAIDSGYQLLDMIAMTISMSSPTLWFWSTGNGGPGYGTAHSITDFTSVHVGAGTTMQYRYWYGYEMAPGYQKWGDVIPFSNSGPGRNGKLNAEVIASGAYSMEPCPLNMLNDLLTTGDGSAHFQIGSGTSHATPTVAGGAALGYQAFMSVYGALPAKDYAKAMLMAAADDMHFDPLKQGAGWLNAGTYADIMAEAAGTASYSSGPGSATSALYPGGVDGVSYESFPNFVLPGEEFEHQITTSNFGDVAVTAEVASELLLRTKTETIDIVTKKMGDTFIDITDRIPASTDLLKVTMYMPFEQFDSQMDYVSDVEYWLELHDWVDLNGNGVMGVKGSGWELFRYTVDGSTCNANQVMIKDPIDRTTDGLIVRVRGIVPNMGIEIGLQLDCYELQEFPWVKVKAPGSDEWSSSMSITIPAKGSVEWSALVSVPEDAIVGSYGAAVYIDDGARVQNMPIVINVPATDYEFEFGGPSYFDTPYNNDVTGVADKLWRFEVGDWRIFWALPQDMPDPNAYLMASVEWSELPTDINLHVLAPVAVDPENVWNGIFDDPLGPGYYEKAVASSDERYMGAGVFGIYTNTGGPKEVIAAPLGAYENAVGTPAPFAIVTRCPVMSGEAASVTLYGETKWVVMNGFGPEAVTVEIDLSENDPISGSVAAWYDITVEGTIEVDGSGVNPMISHEWPGETIYQDILSGDFDADLANAVYTRAITVETASILTVSVGEVLDCPDIDLGLWYDANLDGIADLSEPYWYVGTGGSTESLTLREPGDGQYLVKVLGYTVTGEPGVFSLSVMQGIQGASISAAGLEPLVSSGVHWFTVEYSVPAVPGVYVGAATFGFLGADDMFSIEVVATVVE